MRYEVHVSRWERDAFSIIREHAVNAEELLRVHVMGGSGTLSEAVSAIVNLPNIQIAAYPFGNENTTIRYFGTDKMHLFTSIRSQVLSSTTPFDAIRCGHRYGISHGIVGFEATAGREGMVIYENSSLLSQDAAHFLAAAKKLFRKQIFAQEYKINLDGNQLDGTYASVLIANGPCYAKNMTPAVDAHPNDGLFDVYIMKRISRLTFLSIARKYLSGNYKKIPEIISHHRGTKISISSDSIMTMIVDDKPFYEKEAEFEILPYAVDFVCPGGIDVAKLPRIFGKAGQGAVLND